MEGKNSEQVMPRDLLQNSVAFVQNDFKSDFQFLKVSILQPYSVLSRIFLAPS